MNQNYSPYGMPQGKAKTREVRHQKSVFRPIAPAAPNATPYLPLPLPPLLAQNMNILIVLSRRIESIAHGLSYQLFTTPMEQHNARARMLQLQSKYVSLRAQVDYELSVLGYINHTNVPCMQPSLYTNNQHQPPMLNTTFVSGANTGKSARTANHKHKYGPTSPQYTVDKALKRKAHKEMKTPASARPVKRRKSSVDSDYVETDCESESEAEEDTSSPPEAITYIALVPLGTVESERLKGWTWKVAVERGGCGTEATVMESPMGTRAPAVW